MLLEHQIHHAECRRHPEIPEQIVPLHGRSARHALVRNRHTRTTAGFYVADNGSTVTLSWQPSGNPSRKWAVQALRQPVGYAHPSAGQPDPRNPAQILPGGCRICRRQGRQRLWGPGPGSSSQKVEKLFPAASTRRKIEPRGSCFLNNSKTTHVQTPMHSHGADMNRRRFIALSSLAALGTISQARQQGHPYNHSTR